MKKNISGGIGAAIIVVVLAVIGFFAYKMFAKPSYSAEEIKQARSQGMANQHYAVDPERANLRGGYHGPQPNGAGRQKLR